MTRLSIAVLAASLLAACSGGGNATPTATATENPRTLGSPAPAPTATATLQPGATPTASPTPAVFIFKTIGGAPLTATASQLSTARRTAQAHTQAQGVTNGLPILVESSGMDAAWAGDQTVWVSNAQTSADIAETGGTITSSGTLPLNNPGFSALSCLGSLSAVCIVHPMGWEFGTSSANGKPVGKQTLTIAFADGTTGATTDDVYDGWLLPCNSGFAYVSGIPVAQASRATSDVYADCVAGNMVFPKAGALFLTPAQDQYGRNETLFPTVLAAIFLPIQAVNFPMASIAHGAIYAINTQDGGMAKIYFDGASSTTVNGASGMSLHASSDGSYPF